MVARGADGQLPIGKRRSRDIHRLLERREVPMVTARIVGKADRRSSVGFDGVSGAAAPARRDT